MTTMVDWVKHRSQVQLLLAFLFCIMIGASLALVIGRTQPPPTFWIVFGGNTDPGDGNGGGLARQQLIDGGWVDDQHVFQVTWNAHIEQGTKADTSGAMAAGRAAYDEHCGSGNRCIIAGFSLGTMPALELSKEAGADPGSNYIFGGPEPATGIWHDQYTANPFVDPGLQEFGQFDTGQFVPAGTQVFFDTRDPYANAAPQCSIPYALTLDGHRIVTKGEADGSHQWTGPDGALNHEVGYVAPPGLPLSGSDPSPVYAGCDLNDWKNNPNGQLGGGGLPIPGGSPIPSSGGNMPAVPGLPSGVPTGVPGVPAPPTP